MTYLPANARAHPMPAIRQARTGYASTFVRALILLALDAAALWFAFWLAYRLRYSYEIGGQILAFNRRDFSDFHGRIALFAVFCLTIMLVRGVYRLSTWTPLLDETGLVAGSVTIAMGGLVLTAYLSQFSPSRLLFVYAWALSLVMLFFVRVGWRQSREALWARDIGVRRVLIAGNGTAGRRLMQMLLSTPGMGIRIAGFVDEGPHRATLTAGTARGVMHARYLGSLEDLPSILERNAVDEVILALPSERHTRILEIANWCRSASVPVRVVPDLLQFSLDRIQLDEISGVPILSVREASIRGANAVLKRAIDLIGAVLLLAVLAVPMAIAALAIRRRQDGPVLQRRTMVGRCGVPFSQLRFAIPEPSLGDPDKTTWLQRTHLDGAPQLVNVLRGEMSLVGPRAQAPLQIVRYQDWQRQRLLIAPGLTGLWFSNGRNDLTFDEMVRLDLFYAEHWTVWLDLKILLRTAIAIVEGRAGS